MDKMRWSMVGIDRAPALPDATNRCIKPFSFCGHIVLHTERIQLGSKVSMLMFS